jgi:hypothetical protein
LTGSPNRRGRGRGGDQPLPLPRGSNADRDRAEAGLIGLCIQGNPEPITEARRILPPTGAFYDRRCAAAWDAICALTDRGVTPDRANLPGEMRAQGYRIDEAIDRVWLGDLYIDAPLSGSVGWYAEEVRKYAYQRRIHVAGLRLQQRAETGDLDRLPDLVEQVRGDLDELAAGAAAAPAAIELDAFLGVEDEGYDWLVPGLIERGDRVLLTGAEGKGKSTLLRQFAVQVASGIHPFNFDDITPGKVLVIDLENSERQSRRKYRPLRAAAGDRYDPLAGGLHIEVRAEGIDLLDTASGDGPWLVDLAKRHTPDLIIIGPIYKMAGGDPTEEMTAKAITKWLDLVRRDTGAAMLIEAHSPYPAGRGPRPIRPYGASLWSRWPEFGIFLDGDTGLFEHWRGPRDERAWPEGVKRGGEWPWTAITPEQAELIRKAAKSKARGGESKGPTARDRVLEALEAMTGPATSEQLRSWIYEKHELTLSRQTCSIELNALMKAGFADQIDQGNGKPKLWIAGDLGTES